MADYEVVDPLFRDCFNRTAHVDRLWTGGRWTEGPAYFAGGLFTSEVWFGWATEEDLQPTIDGLSFDEVLLITTLPGIAAVVVVRDAARRARRHRQDAASSRAVHRIGRRRDG